MHRKSLAGPGAGPSKHARAATMDLLELERRFWLEGAQFYRQNLAEQVLMVFPGIGPMRRAEAIAGVENAPRWTQVEIVDEQTLELGPTIRLLYYRATAGRQEDGEYSVFVSSVYVLQGGEWKLTFHQQTP